MNTKVSLVICFLLGIHLLSSQEFQMQELVLSDTDTVYHAQLDRVSITSPRLFADNEEYRRYRYYRKCATKVFPYAAEAIRALEELEAETEGIKRSKKKKYAKRKKKELEKKFKDPLKNLTKIQGMILVSMIEKKTDRSMHEIIDEYRGWVPAAYWNSTGSLFGYDLKEKYQEGQDPILDAVLVDFKF